MPINRSDWLNELNKLKPPSGFCGIGVPSGWKTLVCDLYDSLEALGVEYYICQIKEKFGGLRYYFEIKDESDNHHYDRFNKVIALYETKSLQTCEFCGKEGKRGSHGGWVVTECEDCRRKVHLREVARCIQFGRSCGQHPQGTRAVTYALECEMCAMKTAQHAVEAACEIMKVGNKLTLFGLGNDGNEGGDKKSEAEASQK